MNEFRELIELLPRLETPSDSIADIGDPLLALRSLQPRGRRDLVCPRVFISHRQCDKSEALRVAWVATQQQFDYWLDILDPQIAAAQIHPALTTYQQAILIASIVELALLNCTHVLAVMTANVYGTMWIPYEYGRVKDSALTSVRAGAWFDESWTPLAMPEYFHLGQIFRSEADVRNWFSTQFSQWNATQPNAAWRCASKQWSFTWTPPPLPKPQKHTDLSGDTSRA